ncbi:hypothetical protein [Alkalibacterium sp.]|nr:MAG: hypothetical protein EA249_06175 [Alkalibacterium sp.]
MNYKKLIGLLAVSTLALAACDTDEDLDMDETGEEVDDSEETTDDTDTDTDTDEDADTDTDTDEDADDEDGESSGQSAHDIIDGIDGDLGYTSSIELEITGGSWSQDGYIFTLEDGEATVNGSAAAEDDVYAFVLQDGEVVDKPEVEEGAFTYTTSEEGEYQIGVSDEDVWEVGDEGDAEELVRYENVIIQGSEDE